MSLNPPLVVPDVKMSSVQTVEQATQVALAFVRKYYVFASPLSAKKTYFQWIIDLDISYYKPSYARIRIGIASGTVEDFIVTPGQLL